MQMKVPGIRLIGSILMLFVVAARAPANDTSDLGDAPDSTNNFGVPMYDVTLPEYAQADYPTVFNDGNTAGPFGPIHWKAKAVAYLGDDVTSEEEADIGTDQDGGNNIYPEFSASNGDLADDGVDIENLCFSHMPGSTFRYNVTVVTPNIPLYVNAWFDWNHDGDCPRGE